MVRSDEGLKPAAAEMMQVLRSLSDFSHRALPTYHVHQYDPLIDSSDMTTGDWNADSLPELVCEGLTAALEAVSDRCVVVCTGGTGLSHAMVSRFVAGVGLEHCGPGQRRAPAV